jgi:1,4-dihydroxy-2-naphthoate octaprenyltransferase
MMQTRSAILPTMHAWFDLSRPPFHLVGVLPFVLGNVLAWQHRQGFDWLTASLGCAAVVLIMLATYYSGEYFDYEVDLLSARMNRNRFSGGTQVLQSGGIVRRNAFRASLASLGLAGVLGCIIQFGLGTGPLTILLGALGMVAGFFYTTRPVQWSYRGVGEIIIGFSYGWLPIATAYYLQAGDFSATVAWVSLPVGFSIFNVILINEFPDYPADRTAGKRNLVVRFGPDRMVYLFALASAAVWATTAYASYTAFPAVALLFFAPIFLVSALSTVQALQGGYKDARTLERLCAMTLVVNLGTTLYFILCVTACL